MNRKQIKTVLLAAAISTPGSLVAGAASAETSNTYLLAHTKTAPSSTPAAPSTTLRATSLTEARARDELQKELKALTPAQRREFGEDRIARLQRMSPKQLLDTAVAAGAGQCVSQGVGCTGTPGFSKGFICCLAKKI